MTQTAIRCSIMRGGTSRGLYFHAADLPADRAIRDAVLVTAMGSPNVRQIDGLGGAHTNTSKVAVVWPSESPEADVEYLFLQVWPDRAEVSEDQNCGNLLAAVGPFALEERLHPAKDGVTPVRIRMVNTGSIVVAHIRTPDGRVAYDGDARIDGVLGTHAPVPIEFPDVAGSTCGRLLPTARALDVIDGVEVTCIDNGMPVICLRAADVGLTGDETPAEIEGDEKLRERLESIRMAAGPRMNLGDVRDRTVPKITMLSPPRNGGVVSTRTLTPFRAHEAIGVFGAVSVATACLVPGSVATDVADPKLVEAAARSNGQSVDLEVEHPAGFFTVSMALDTAGDEIVVRRSALLRTARLLMRGEVFVPRAVWEGPGA